MLLASSLCGALAGGAVGYAAASQRSTGASSAPGAIDVPAIVDRAGASVVTIDTTIATRVGPRTTTGQAAGTGIVLTADGMVLTNAHVIAGATTISVTVSGETTPRDASVLMTDTAADVAVLRIGVSTPLKPAPLDTSGHVRVGEDVVAIGNALALEGSPTVTKGIVSGLGRSITTDTTVLDGLIQTDAAISSGDSGGPLLDDTGAVIGLNTAGASSGQNILAENVAFAIPIARVIDVLKSAGIVVG